MEVFHIIREDEVSKIKLIKKLKTIKKSPLKCTLIGYVLIKTT